MNDALTSTQMRDDAALMSLESQLRMAEVVGDRPYQVDLDQRRFEFVGDGAENIICTGMHLLGSAAPGAASWLWSWANPGAYPEDITRTAQLVSEFFGSHGLISLSRAEVPFSVLDSDNAVDVAVQMATLSKPVSGRWSHYQFDAGSGTRAVFLLEHPLFVLPAPSVARVLRVVVEAAERGSLTDHRRAVESYARFRPLKRTWSQDWSMCDIAVPDGTVSVSFDPAGRIVHAVAGAST